MKPVNIETVLKEHLQSGKIKLPNWAKRVKLDIGVSTNAPNSEIWLQSDSDLCVFGFEPNTYSIQSIKQGGSKRWAIQLDPSRYGKSFYCINTALSDTSLEEVDFYCTEDDPGTSSLYKPRNLESAKVIKVPVIKLQDFFDFFPWDTIPYIEQVKIDAQSADYAIVKGMGSYLQERVVYLDIETSTNGYYYSEENPTELRNYIEANGFECITWGLNATFCNTRYLDIVDNIHYSILGD
jgi:FkbM family methyltransferase